MPGLVAFGRRWSVGSDDLFVPSVCLCFIHSVWLITTLVAVVSESEYLWSKADKVPCASHLWELVVLIVLLLAACFLLEAGLTIVSLRGSILTDAPRKPAQYIIYILLTVLAGKLIWSGFAVAWLYQFYLDCSLNFLKQVILGLVICTWLIFLGVIMTAWCTYDVAGRSWVKMKRYQANMKEMELKNPAYRRSGSRHRNWRQRKVIRAYQNSWNHRCHLLFCCMHRTERHTDSFTDLAKLLSEFFRDLDVVPTDVVVGLLLLRRLQRLEQCSIVKQKRNNTYEFLSGIAITPKTKFVAMNDPIDLEIFRNVVHFMHYASAAYGWPWYVIPHGVKGVCNLCSNLSCCCCRGGCRRGRHQPDLSDVVVEDNCCYCNYAVIPTMFDPDTFEVVHATYHVDVGETPYFVVIDYEKEAVVVSIRGTLSLKDVITDLNAEGEPLPLNPPREDWQGHKGMIQAAVYMKAQLVGQRILEKAFNRVREKRTAAESFRLVIVGHSLGAGTATILAVLLKEEYPNLQCYAYSPPGGLLSMPVVEYTKEFVTSVIVGKDVVPRIGLSQMEALRADLLHAIKKSCKPKWHTILSGMTCCFCVKPEFALPQRLSSAPSIQSEEFMRSRRSLRDLREVTINPNESAISLTVHQPLYPPGRIMHIVRHHPKKDEIKYETMWRKLTKKGEPVFQALWTENTDYGQVLISPGMIQDHMPDQVLRALHRVVNNHGPAKPQRTLAASTSPLMLSRDSLAGDSGSKSSPNKICMENVSFANNSSSSKPSPECTLMNPNPLIIDADAEVENDGELTPTNMGLTDLLAKFNLSWDYVTNLQERYLEKEDIMLRQQQCLPPDPPLPPCGHERRDSFDNSSSGCSDVGSTFKEIFGPIKYDEWMAPLASPETLSEISSLSSRASFLIPKDQSPLLRMKGMKNGTSSSLHRYKNGKANGFGLGAPCSTFHNNNGHHHSRSFSCTYPEISDVSIISSGLCGQSQSTKGSFYYGSSNGGSKIRVNDNNGGGTEGYGGNGVGSSSGPENGKCHFIVTESDYHSESHHFSEKDTTNGHGKSDDIQLTPTADSPTHYEEPMRTKANGDTKRVSFNLKKKYASKDSGCSVGDVSFTPSTPGRYDPVYPIFSHQEEYGVPTLNEPHYNYCGQSPQESPQHHPSTFVYKQQDDPQNPAFQFPILTEILTEINARAANGSSSTTIHIPADEPVDEEED